MRLVGGAAVLGALVWHAGTGAFLRGLRGVDVLAAAEAAGIAAVSTVCTAWRWSLVARRLGLVVPMRTAVAACYRSQFLNATLPGGILGDVHRAARAGREAGDLGRSVQAVAWERTVGQGVQLLLTLVVVLVLPSPWGPALPLVGASAVTAGIGIVIIGRARIRRGGLRRCERPPVAGVGPHRGRLAWGVVPAIVLASGLVVIGHTATFLIAARAAGSLASPMRLVPLVLVVQVASAIPVNLAGWGPREGAAAWVFGAAGLGAAEGLGASVVYGILVMVATLPGAVLLLVSGSRFGGRAADPTGVLPQGPGGPGWSASWLSVRTPCSAAACRSTATSTAPRGRGSCCPTTPTSTGSTRCEPGATPSS